MSHKPRDNRKTADVKPSMVNGKPFRTAEQKADARANAYTDSDGTTRTTAPVSYHPRKSNTGGIHAGR